MKIAIRGHELRGKEIAKILESIGGKNLANNSFMYNDLCYYLDSNNFIICAIIAPLGYREYTLEEFEKEFPFKIGDKVIDYEGNIAVIIGFTHIEEKLGYSLQYKNSRGTATSRLLKPYKEMERNITLTLDKAKEWYKKGGELKEIALQAFTEKELNPLPRSWEEFCEKYRIEKDESYITSEGKIVSFVTTSRRAWNHICPSRKSAEAHLAMIQLEQLRDCYNNNSEAWGWSYSIIKRGGIPELVRGCDHDTFLRFNNETVAKEFLKNFRDLIEKAGDLI